MLNELLTTKIQVIKEYADLKTKESNKKKQEAIDLNFKEKIKSINSTIRLVSTFKDELSFQIDNESIQGLKLFLEEIQTNLKNNYVDQNIVDSIFQKNELIVRAMRNLWPGFYRDNIINTVGLLKVVRATNPKVIDSCINEINLAANLPNKVLTVKNLKKQLIIANQIIGNLKLNDAIIEFLKKINNGSATILDLNEEVLVWIKDEQLENKIKLSM